MGTDVQPHRAMRAYLPVLGRLLVLALALAIVTLPACTTQALPAPTPTTYANLGPGPVNVALLSADDGWAAADTGLLHYHAGTWTAVLM